MCGIAGYIGPKEIPEDRVSACLRAMDHRGPDANGRYRHAARGENVLLLHTRLAIIDLDPRSGQPFRMGGKALVFNGELYNYLEVKAALEKRGRRFATDGDTEVLLAGIDTLGDSALDQYDGMWAFALYDEADGGLKLCRDRFGEKPLYLHREGTGLYFGSEPKFIHALLGHNLPIDLNHLHRYLVNGYRSLHKGTNTYFQGLEELPSGRLLARRPGGGKTEDAYWNPVSRQDPAMEYRDAVEGARKALIDAVSIRLRADVPIAFCMSGGVDSNALISIAKRVFGYQVHGFTIANSDSRYDEGEMVAASVRDLGIRHTSIPLETKGFLGKLRGLVAAHDGPVSTITYYVHWLLMKSVAEHGYKISLSGTGADELFTGYFDHHLAYLKEIEGDPVRYPAALEAWRKHILPGIQNPYFQNPRLFSDNPAFRDHIFQDCDLFTSRLVRPWTEAFADRTWSGDLLRNRMLNELFHEVVPPILHEDDLNAMCFSIENRSPFLSRPLFDFCQSIPTRHLVRDGYAKAVLRDAMRGIAPDAILGNRTKVGFNAPVLSLLDPADPEVKDCLLDPRSPVFEIVRREAVEELLERPHLPNSESKFLFNFLNAKLFLETFGS
ncbi:MAG: asparagine synthase (glutamine-hydrolyzing) [Fibrobacteria bacterium]